MRLDGLHETKLTRFAQALVDQQAARIAVPAQAAAAGYWFGGGSMIAKDDGRLYLVGRYRNPGDSRTGLEAGQRGLELAIFCSADGGTTFDKVVSFGKADLDVGPRRVLSIEGSALHWIDGGVELFVSSEKTGIGYPAGWESYHKPETGVWTIERLQAEGIEALQEAAPETIIESADPRFLHVKDPVAYDAQHGELVLLFCTHPYCWSSSNTALTVRARGLQKFDTPCFDFFPRGFSWDVAMTRGTAVIDVPPVGIFRDVRVSLLFYDGGESLRNLDEHTRAVRRPRGYSCEEIGGVAYFTNGDFAEVHRLSENLPLLVSPWGTGCSRYVDVLRTAEGFIATWQQSQSDWSQPLAINFLSNEAAENILTT